MRLVVGHDVAVANWAANKLGAALNMFTPPYVALGAVDNSNMLRGAFVIHAHSATVCELTIYSERAITPNVAKLVFRTMFDRLGFACCIIHTDRKNKAVKRAAPKLGFKFKCAIEHFYDVGVDVLQYTMTRETCRWIDHNEVKKSAAAA